MNPTQWVSVWAIDKPVATVAGFGNGWVVVVGWVDGRKKKMKKSEEGVVVPSRGKFVAKVAGFLERNPESLTNGTPGPEYHKDVAKYVPCLKSFETRTHSKKGECLKVHGFAKDRWRDCN